VSDILGGSPSFSVSLSSEYRSDGKKTVLLKTSINVLKGTLVALKT
jgi:hypothetical protein